MFGAADALRKRGKKKILRERFNKRGKKRLKIENFLPAPDVARARVKFFY